MLPKHIETQETWLWEHQQVPGQVDLGMNGRQYGTVGSSKVKAWILRLPLDWASSYHGLWWAWRTTQSPSWPLDGPTK